MVPEPRPDWSHWNRALTIKGTTCCQRGSDLVWARSSASAGSSTRPSEKVDPADQAPSTPRPDRRRTDPRRSLRRSGLPGSGAKIRVSCLGKIARRQPRRGDSPERLASECRFTAGKSAALRDGAHLANRRVSSGQQPRRLTRPQSSLPRGRQGGVTLGPASGTAREEYAFPRRYRPG